MTTASVATVEGCVHAIAVHRRECACDDVVEMVCPCAATIILTCACGAPLLVFPEDADDLCRHAHMLLTT